MNDASLVRALVQTPHTREESQYTDTVYDQKKQWPGWFRMTLILGTNGLLWAGLFKLFA